MQKVTHCISAVLKIPPNVLKLPLPPTETFSGPLGDVARRGLRDSYVDAHEKLKLAPPPLLNEPEPILQMGLL